MDHLRLAIVNAHTKSPANILSTTCNYGSCGKLYFLLPFILFTMYSWYSPKLKSHQRIQTNSSSKHLYPTSDSFFISKFYFTITCKDFDCMIIYRWNNSLKEIQLQDTWSWQIIFFVPVYARWIGVQQYLYNNGNSTLLINQSKQTIPRGFGWQSTCLAQEEISWTYQTAVNLITHY